MSDAVYLVLGATGGIGAELCRALSREGARLAVAARPGERLDALAAQLDALAIPTDATRFEEVDACVAQTVETWGRLTGVANCVGSLLLKPAHITRPEEWDATIALNLTSAFAVVRAATRAMADTGGSIVLLSSAAARAGLANHEAIAAAKAGVIGLAKSAAATYAPKEIRVNAVAPGLVRTGLTERITSSKAGEEASLAMHALGRLGEPADVARAIAWLLRPENDWVTGQVFGVGGGLAAVRTR
jgi:NAD(P)-dependent dehydrogenase (short-subunit alcohol dehydrogenase family)